MPSPATTDTPTITPALFALALHDLPLESVYAKAAELENSIAHLVSSNEQLAPYAAAGDADCVEAIAENEGVLARVRERVQLCRAEVEGRGLRWSGHVVPNEQMEGSGDGTVEEVDANGVVEGVANGIANGVANGVVNGDERQSGRLTDEELMRRLQAQMAEEDEEGGVHL